MQAFEYEKRDNSPGNLQEFFTNTEGKIKNPFLGTIEKEISNQRAELCKVRESG